MGIEIWLIIWLFTHGIYRGLVGTWCAVTKTDPPWVRSRQERLTNREVRRAGRREALASKRTARGFAFRIWGNFWEDATDAIEERRARRMNTPDAPTAEGRPIVSVDADQAADWARNLGVKAKSAWSRLISAWDNWWAPSRQKCPWLTPVLDADHTQVEGRACGQRVRLRATYCPPHEAFAAIGHCLRFNGDAAIPPCTSPRHKHYPYCLPHLEEWGNNAADRESAASSTPEAAQVGTLDTPDAPKLAATEMTDEQRQMAAKIKDAWLRGELVEPDPSNAEWFALPVSVRAELLKAAEDGGIRFDTTFDPDARTHAGLPIGWRKTDQPAAPPATTSTEPVAPAPVEADASEPAPEPDTSVQPETATATEPEPEGSPQRPMLRVVSNTNTQGDTNTMTAPSEITNVQSLKNFAEKVKAHGSQEWPSMLENAESQIGAAGLSNDPAITSEIGAMREAAGMFAAAGDRLEVALRPHESAAEQISGLGNRAADQTATYQNQ